MGTQPKVPVLVHHHLPHQLLVPTEESTNTGVSAPPPHTHTDSPRLPAGGRSWDTEPAAPQLTPPRAENETLHIGESQERAAGFSI